MYMFVWPVLSLPDYSGRRPAVLLPGALGEEEVVEAFMVAADFTEAEAFMVAADFTEAEAFMEAEAFTAGGGAKDFVGAGAVGVVVAGGGVSGGGGVGSILSGRKLGFLPRRSVFGAVK